MFSIDHGKAIELERIVRALYKCDRGGISGLATAGYFERNPMQAAVLVIAFIHAKGFEMSPYQYDEFLSRYETIFNYPDENNADDEVQNYIDELESIVESYI